MDYFFTMDFLYFELLFLGVPVAVSITLAAGLGKKLRSTFAVGKTIHELLLCTVCVWGTLGMVINIVQIHNLRKMEQQEAACKAHKVLCRSAFVDNPSTPF